MNATEQKLRELIGKQLDKCCSTKYADLGKFISTPEGKKRASEIIFSMCATEGISVQQAMSALDSDINQ